MLLKCVNVDSKLLLEIEQNIKNVFVDDQVSNQNKVLFLFSAVFAGFNGANLGQ